MLDGAEGFTSLRDLLGTHGRAARAHRSDRRDTAVLPYSSGTTGRAKGVILTHRNLVANLCQFEPVFQIDVRRPGSWPCCRSSTSTG